MEVSLGHLERGCLPVHGHLRQKVVDDQSDPVSVEAVQEFVPLLVALLEFVLLPLPPVKARRVADVHAALLSGDDASPLQPQQQLAYLVARDAGKPDAHEALDFIYGQWGRRRLAEVRVLSSRCARQPGDRSRSRAETRPLILDPTGASNRRYRGHSACAPGRARSK